MSALLFREPLLGSDMVSGKAISFLCSLISWTLSKLEGGLWIKMTLFYTYIFIPIEVCKIFVLSGSSGTVNKKNCIYEISFEEKTTFLPVR